MQITSSPVRERMVKPTCHGYCFWLWAIAVTVLITPIVITAGFGVARLYGPFVAVILVSIAWAYIAAMAYIALRTIGKMFGHQ
jgi:hypothetical protein